MKIGVTGYGVVGRATADVLRRLGHSVVVSDTDPGAVAAAIAEGYDLRDGAAGPQVDFLCVPETHLEEALLTLPADTLTVIRSTVPPGTTDRFSAQFGRRIAYMPEFLREATAQWDAMNPQFVLIGTNDRREGALLAEIFAPLMVQVIQVTPPIAEMVKITLNAYLHTLISFWNEIHMICERVGLPSHLVGKLCSQDPRVASYGAVLHGQPAGGRCLPKDIAQLIDFTDTIDYSPDLLLEVQRVNQKIMLGYEPAKSNGHNPLEDSSRMLPTGVVNLSR